MTILNGQFPSIEQAAGEYLNNRPEIRTPADKTRSFAEVFANKQTEDRELKFSKHAANRLSERNIELSDKVMDRLQAGTVAAEQKGINESLVMVDQLAFIVNVKNQTVITALDKNDSNGNVFTNIDGAVIA